MVLGCVIIKLMYHIWYISLITVPYGILNYSYTAVLVMYYGIIISLQNLGGKSGSD